MRLPSLLMIFAYVASNQSDPQVTGTFAGAWLSAVYSNIACPAHPTTPDLYICAVHDTGFTKMVGYTISTWDATPVQIAGRYYTTENTNIDPKNIGDLWDNAPRTYNNYAISEFSVIRQARQSPLRLPCVG